MDILEISSQFSEMWNTFCVPFIKFFIIVAVIWFIAGKEIYEKVVYDGIIFKKKNGMYIPLISVKDLKKIIKKYYVILIVAFLVLVYGTNEFLTLIEKLNPITYSTSTKDLLLFALEDYWIAGIWSYYPDLPFIELPELISELAEDRIDNDFHVIYFEIRELYTFIVLSGIVMLLLPKPKRFLRRMGKVLAIICISTVIMIMTYIYVFNAKICDMQQDGYYALHKCQVENENSPESNIEYEKCYMMVEEERRIAEEFEEGKVFEFVVKYNFIVIEKLFGETDYNMDVY